MYKPLTSYQKYYTIRIGELQRLQELSYEKEKEYQLLQKNYLENKRSFAQEKNNYANDSGSLNDSVAAIFTKAHDAQLTLHAHAPFEMVDHDWYNAYLFTDEFQGSFESIINFLNVLKNSSGSLMLSKLSITATANGLHLLCSFGSHSLQEEPHAKKNA